MKLIQRFWLPVPGHSTVTYQHLCDAVCEADCRDPPGLCAHDVAGPPCASCHRFFQNKLRHLRALTATCTRGREQGIGSWVLGVR